MTAGNPSENLSENMYSVLEVIRLVVGITAGFTGIGLNVWIIAVNVSDWRKVGSPPSSVDLILSFLGLANTLEQAVLTLDVIFTGFLSYTSFAAEVHLRCLNVLICSAACNLWSSIWLCTYYCCRIVTFTNGILFYLKIRIPVLIPKLLAITVIMAICFTLPSFWNIYPAAQSSGQNATHDHRIIVIRVPYMYTVLVTIIIPILFTLIPTGLTLTSLWRHTKRMKKNTPDSSPSLTRAHVTASRTMVLLLTLHMLFCASAVKIVLSSFNAYYVAEHFSWYYVYIYTTMQAVVLINGNSKLRRAGQEMLNPIYSRCGVVCQDDREDDL